MLEKQGLDEFMSTISKGKAVIVSVSPQSRASIAAHFGVSPLQVSGDTLLVHNFFPFFV
jgi:iron only hydrogenase large subunit-like protein